MVRRTHHAVLKMLKVTELFENLELLHQLLVKFRNLVLIVIVTIRNRLVRPLRQNNIDMFQSRVELVDEMVEIAVYTRYLKEDRRSVQEPDHLHPHIPT
jgi:hypothetical protein